MVSLTMMARLLEAVRPQSRLLLVGDPDQLASVEAGAVLADLVDGLGRTRRRPVAALKTSHRFGESIGALASAIRDGDARPGRRGAAHRRTSTSSGSTTDDPTARLRKVLVPHALALRQAAILGDATAALATLDEHRLLCAHRRGPVRRAALEPPGRAVARPRRRASRSGRPGTSGRPILVTANDYGLGLYNGDTGVAVHEDGVLRAVIGSGDEPLEFAPSRLSDVETMHAMTIHKSQGSQADEVTVLMPPADSRLLTRELLYTAVTRAQSAVRIVGSEAQVRQAIESQRAVRATRARAPTSATTMTRRIRSRFLDDRPVRRYGLSG